MENYAQYGNILIPADKLAQIRGSGNYDEPPKRELTTNYGPAYSNAFNMYNHTTHPEHNYVPATDYTPLDVNNTKNYIVGSTGFHLENYKIWGDPLDNSIRKDFQGSDRYQDWAQKSMQLTPNALLNFFFCENNVNYIQQRIKEEIYKIKGIQIRDQSTDEILIIMRNNYMYALYGWLPVNANEPNKVYGRGPFENNNGLAYNSNVNGGSSLKYQIFNLNKAVIQECVKQILSGINSYELYIRDSGSLPLPQSLPVLATMKGSKELQENLGFHSGREMSKMMSSFNQRYNIL